MFESATSIQGVAILLCLAATILTGAVSNPSLGDLSRPPWQPKDTAFAIWGLIYLAIAVGGGLQLSSPIAKRASPWATGVLCASLLCCAGWLVAVRRNVVLSAALIVAATVASLASLVLQPPFKDPSSLSARLVTSGTAFLAGWLSLAAPLGISLAVQSRTAAPLPWWAAVPSVVVAAALATYAGSPEVGAVFLWAAAFVPRGQALGPTLAVFGGVTVLGGLLRTILCLRGCET